MRRLSLLLVALAVSTPALTQTLPGGVNLDEPSTLDSRRSCASECEGVYSDCRTQCGETKARAHEEHFDLPDMPVDTCLRDCRVQLTDCVRDCGM